MTNLAPFFPSAVATAIAGLIAIVQLIIALVMAVAVSRDANERKYRNCEVYLISPTLWGFVVFFSGGLLGVIAYWAVHHSSLSTFGGESNK
jgi:TctA family transporter